MLKIFILLFIVSFQAHAQHAVHPKNLNLDKNNHFAVGTALGVFDWKLGCAAGAAKEINDSQTHDADLQHFIAACAGSGLSHWLGDGKSKLYKYNVVAIILDGLSTDNAIRQGGFEVGVPKYFIGTTPNTAKIAAFTAFRLWLLNKSEGWGKGLKDSFQWGTAISGTFVVYANYTIEFK